MIEKIILKNFQKHKYKEVTFSKGQTTLSGKTGAGKSVLIRALKWLCLNTPSEGFIQHGKKFCSVTVHVDGHIITRKKGKNNVYILDGKVLKAFGSKVPDVVADILNLEEMNFQDQIDPPYWFADSPGKVSKELNRIVDLGAIDDTLKKVQSAVGENKASKRIIEARFKASKMRCGAFKWAKAFSVALKGIEAREESFRRASRKRQKLEDLLRRIHKLKARSQVTLPDIGPLEDARKKADAVAERNRELWGMIRRIEEKSELLKEEQETLLKMEEDLKKYKPKRCKTCGQVLK